MAGPSQWRAARLAGVRLTAFFTVRFAAFLAAVRLTAFFTVRFAAFLAGVRLTAFFTVRFAAFLAAVRLTAFFTVRFAAFLAGVRLTAFFTVRFAAFLAGCVLLAVFVALRLAAPAFVVPVLALAGLLRRFEPDLALPTTLREPILGANVDSSPVDHFTCKRDPITPVTTPSRGAWPTFVDATCIRSPSCTSLVAGIRSEERRGG